MATVINRAKIAKELEPGLNALFGLDYSSYEQEHTLLYSTEGSEKAFEEEVMLYGLAGAPVKGEGAAIAYDTTGEAWTVRATHETIALAFALTEEAIEDNLYASLGKRNTKALARAMAHTKQVKAVVPFNNGFTSFTTGDGVAFFSTSHPLVSGGTLANRPSTDADLSETSLEAAAIAIHGWVDERGLPVMIKPKRLVIAANEVFNADRILKSERRVGTADNDLNALKNIGVFPGGYTVNHYLTDPDAWFIMTDAPNGPKMFQRVAMSKGMEGDFETGNVRYKARERYSFMIPDPRVAYGSTGG